MKIITEIAEMKEFSRNLKKSEKKISFVPTMGKLHAGHVKLIESAKRYGETIVSIFVNPLQFGRGEDFDKYPRDIENDEKILSGLDVSVLFYPESDIVKNTDTFIVNPEYSKKLEGLFRPSHFQGVLTIVMKLFCIIEPDFAFFGLKDYQQYVLVKKMAEDFFLNIKIIPVETVREESGIAMSSRNTYLDVVGKEAASAFYKILSSTADLFKQGEKSPQKLTGFAVKELIKNGFKVDYVEITDPALNRKYQNAENGDILLAAIRCKGVRLIDNVFLS
ncbi:MAG: pantoate--beta-alanine ligase [Candidatus Acidulodesulfobacterium acidiphilum]|uniref:Pantothenate synthetase n=1 Tax=Candidatus Acidulodesulfobacterium acidiphilum TaxID=2597224 RepID=A0A520XAU0_9DELT|nr:MAG: pantoate--beta-alanine ligase [Candidatus Acidulodesulfobacterium acidiphilum]